MEVAIRAWNLLAALWVLSIRRPPDPELALEAAALLVASGRFILAHLEDDTAIPNNHLADRLARAARLRPGAAGVARGAALARARARPGCGAPWPSR